MSLKNLKIAIAQLDYHTGNFDYNTQKIISNILQAKDEGADLIVFSELCVCGYPPRDFLEFDDFIDHSYDNEIDDKKRFNLIVREIEKLNGADVKNFYNTNIDRLIENKKIISEISNDTFDIEYFKKLTKSNG